MKDFFPNFLITALLFVVVIQLGCLLGWIRKLARQLESKEKIKASSQPEEQKKTPVSDTPVPEPVKEPPVKTEPVAEVHPEPVSRPPETDSRKTNSFEFAPAWITDWIFVRGKYRKSEMSAEYAVATAWLIRIGVLILLCGIGFLSKYIIEHNMFPPVFRVAGMFLLAVLLFAVGVKMTATRYSSVALGIIGLSFATGYLSIFTGSRLYGLIGVPWAYGAMIVLTAFFMTFSVRKDYIFPALIGVLGGYLTPFLLNSRGFAPEWQLGYLTVVTAGVLFCAFFRSWNFLNWLALVFSFLAQAVILDWFGESARQVASFGLIDGNKFQSVILVIFMLFALLPTLKVTVRHEKLELPDILLHCGTHVSLLLLTMFRFSFEDWKLSAFTLRYILVFAAGLALLQLPLMGTADRTDRNWTVLQLIFAAGALLALIPLEFSVLWMVAGWMILALILLSLGIHLHSVTLAVGAAAAGAAAGWRILIRDLLMKGFFLSGSYLTGLESRLAGIGAFIAGLLLATGIMAYSRRKYPALFERIPPLDPAGFGIVSLSLLFLYSSLELYWMLGAVLPVFRNGGLSLWWGIWAILLLLSGILADKNLPRRLSLVLFGICAVKIFLIDLSSLNALYKVAAFLVLGLLMLGGAVLYTRFKDRIFKT